MGAFRMISRVTVRYFKPNAPRIKIPTTNLIETAPKTDKGRFWRQGKALVKVSPKRCQ